MCFSNLYAKRSLSFAALDMLPAAGANVRTLMQYPVPDSSTSMLVSISR
jgi:hypothetical protein